MYDGCRMPTFDTYGLNNPCPTFDELMELGKRVTDEAQD